MTINKVFGRILQLLSCHIFNKYFDRAYMDFNWLYSLTFFKFQTKYSFSSMHESTRVIGEILMANVSLIEALKLKFDKLILLNPQICNRRYTVEI